MFTRQNNTVGKALRNTQEKGKACLIKKNAVLKKAIKDNKELRLMYGNLKHERDRLKADRDMLLIDLKNTEEERLELIKKNKKITKQYMKLFLQMRKYRTSFVPYPVKAFITKMMRLFQMN